MSRDIALERQMHEDFTPWVAEHSRSTHGLIQDTGYNPEKYSSQQIDVSRSPALINLETEKDKGKAFAALNEQYARIMGSFAAARAQVIAFQEAKAFDSGNDLLVDAVIEYLEHGKSIGLITDHAEGLFDLAKGQGGLSLAISRSRRGENNTLVGDRYIPGFKAWVNKLMTRQFIVQEITGASGKTIKKDVHVPYLLSIGGEVRWVIPDTENGRQFISDEAITRIVNGGALKTFAEDKRSAEGTVEVIVPSGTRMVAKKDENDKTEYLIAPPFSDTSANLLSHLDAVITFSNWAGRISIGQLIEINYDSKLERSNKTVRLAQQIREVLRNQTQSLAGISVVYPEELESVSSEV
jgi:hypothetical protein